MATPVKRVRLGDLLVQHQVIDTDQLERAIVEQKKTGLKLGQQLIAQGDLTEDVLLNFLSRQLGLPFFDLTEYKTPPLVAKQLSEAYARRFRALLLEERDDHYLIGMADPLDIGAIDELRQVLAKPIQLAIIKESELLRALDHIYRRTDDISAYAEALDESVSDEEEVAELVVEQGQVDAPVIKLLQSVFEDAVQVGASDIHIEPDEKVLRIRLRVDGVLQEQVMKERAIAKPIMTRLKLMAELNIAERRLPQDGRFQIKVRGQVIDIRLSTLPTQYGEAAVMRLLVQDMGRLNLANSGMSEALMAQFRHLLKAPHGVILVTGPTGSGKTTTLYGALNELNSSQCKIITAEDPVEYRLDRINQVQVQEKIGLDFATVLKTALRQDPDIILVGEMRDHETATIAIRAALTGHLVLSTLHTNDAPSSALRLMDMNVEGFLVAATLRGVLAQRLVRRVCHNCAQPYELTDSEKTWLKSVCDEDLSTAEFKIGRGCASCRHTGYLGRHGVFELLELDFPMMEALRRNDPGEFSNLATAALKGKLLFHDALRLARQGITTLAEVTRVAGDG